MSEPVTEFQLQAAFLAARKHGHIIQDDVLRDIITAAREALPPWRPASGGPSRHQWFLYRDDSTPLAQRYYHKTDGNVRYFTTWENAATAADKLNAKERAR